MQKERESNFELLRILCMWGVLTNHVLQHLYNLHTVNYSVANEFRMSMMNLGIIAVNCFVLISGYFHIRPKWNSFFNLLTQCAFYAFIFSLIGYICREISLLEGIKRTVFPLTESGMWFIPAYLALFLISPLLNAGYIGLNFQSKKIVLFSLVLVDVYVGYIHQRVEITTDGYHLIHFITLYFIGNFIAEYKGYISELKKNVSQRWIAAFVALIVLLMNVFHIVKMEFFPISLVYSLRYNSPVVMLFSVLFFMWVVTWRIKSRVINWVSASVLSVYLIHSQPVVAKYFFPFLQEIQNNYSAIPAFVLIVFTMVLLYLGSILLDKVRMKSTSRIVEKISSYVENKTRINNA